MEELGIQVYAYCTDFIINLANLLGLSYYEVNTIVFCIVYPLVLVGLTGLYLIQIRRWKKARKNHGFPRE